MELSGQAHRAAAADPFSPVPSLPDLAVAGDVHGGQSGLIHRLSQENSTLTPLDPVNHSFGSYSLAWDDAPSSAGYGFLYLGGYVIRQLADGNWVNRWTVRRGTDVATTWEQVDSFALSEAWSEARGLTVDDEGHVHICGMAVDAAGVSHWIIRKSTDQGATWETRDIFKGNGTWSLTGYNTVAALGISYVPNADGRGGALFVVGTRGKLYAGAWTVSRSTDGGSSWQIVDTDSWVPKKTGSSRARKVAADRTGRIFVLGDTGSRMENDPSPWVVRMSADRGNTWTTIFGPWNFGPCPYPLDLAVDASGNVWAVGVTHNKYGTKKVTYTSQGTWVKLEESPTGAWTANYGFLTREAQGINRASADAIATDNSGGIYVSGSFKANDSVDSQWFVQRRMP